MISSKDGIIGFAIGDAMGVPVEFTNREKLMRKSYNVNGRAL